MELLDRPEARARLLWLAREVMPELTDGQPSPGQSVVALLVLAAVAACWLDGHAALARLLAWTRSRATLARPSLAALPPVPALVLVPGAVVCHPHTGPPALAAALEAPVISP